jgi:hypothetical protein
MIDISSYTFIKERRNGSKIYRSHDHHHFLKIWPSHVVEHEYQENIQLRSHGINLPQVFDYKVDWDRAYMKEISLWPAHFWDLFTQSTLEYGHITDDLWSSYTRQALDHHLHQRDILPWMIQTSPTARDLRATLRIENRLPQEIIAQFQKRIYIDLSHVPTCRTHGDYNPYNVFPNGVIDIEECFDDYRWYDAVSVFHIYRYPSTFEILWRTRPYHISKKQILSYLAAFSGCEFSIADPLVFGPLYVYKSIRSCITDPIPRQDYKYPRFHKMIQAYLDWVNMIDYILDTFDKDVL